MTWVLGLAALLAGCPGRRIACCEAPLSHGALGHYGTCACEGVCEYGALWGDAPCTDDPSGNACVLWTNGRFGPNVRCFDPGGPTQEVTCCEDIGADGVGRLATCRCPLSGDCAWSPYSVAIEPLPEGGCRVHEVGRLPPPRPDAGPRDAGPSFGTFECGGEPCVEGAQPFSELDRP